MRKLPFPLNAFSFLPTILFVPVIFLPFCQILWGLNGWEAYTMGFMYVITSFQELYDVGRFMNVAYLLIPMILFPVVLATPYLTILAYNHRYKVLLIPVAQFFVWLCLAFMGDGFRNVQEIPGFIFPGISFVCSFIVIGKAVDICRTNDNNSSDA